MCEFVEKKADNPIVFAGIVSLVFHFPKLIVVKAIVALVNIDESDITKSLKTESNSIYFLENVLHSYIINLPSKTLACNKYEVCERLLNSLVSLALSKAYYIREHLIKSKRIG